MNDSLTLRCVTGSVDATKALAMALEPIVDDGDLVVLVGDLGAGKTALTKGLGRGLGVSSVVQSPTFVLVQVHEGRLPLWHADFYRLGDASEVDTLGLDELEGGVLVVEWADRFPEALPPDRLEIRLSDEGEGRRAEIEATGPRHRVLEERLGAFG